MYVFCLSGSQVGELRNINSERLDWIRTRQLLFCQSLKGTAKAMGPIAVLLRDFPFPTETLLLLSFFCWWVHRVAHEGEEVCLGLEEGHTVVALMEAH
jgi:hypothetical protein